VVAVSLKKKKKRKRKKKKKKKKPLVLKKKKKKKAMRNQHKNPQHECSFCTYQVDLLAVDAEAVVFHALNGSVKLANSDGHQRLSRKRSHRSTLSSGVICGVSHGTVHVATATLVASTRKSIWAGIVLLLVLHLLLLVDDDELSL